MILVIIYLLIIVFNLKINTVSSEDEKNIENDFLYSKIRAAVLNGDTVIKQGKKKIINERNCYASMLFTSDEGKIVLNQVVIPGGKKKKLSKAVTENLVKLGLSEGVENGPVVVVVEVGAWWGNKGMIQLGRYKSLINNGLVYICIADHQKKSTKRRIGPRTTTHNSQAPDGGVQAFMNAQIHEQLRAWYDDNQ
eukprot:65647_1